MLPSDAIAALSSSAFPAPRAIVRLSGSDSFSIAMQFASDLPHSAGAGRAGLTLRGMQIPATLYRFRAPRSYTGEDIIEFHIPGNPLLVQILLEELLNSGARAAEPGEFTARAYFNGRMDLTQAEGVAAAVSAHSEREALAARRLLCGELTRRLEPIIESVTQTLALLEAGIDFSDEDVSFLPADEASKRIDHIVEQLRGLLAENVRFERLAHEPTVVLAGRPNAGKSTLLNALAGHHRAIVSPLAGTTRDVIWSSVQSPRGAVRITDVAGLEEADSPGDIQRQMRRQALRTIESADVLVLVIDGTDVRPPIALPRAVDLVVYAKSDLAVVSTVAASSPSPGTPDFPPWHGRPARVGDAGVEEIAISSDSLRFCTPNTGGTPVPRGKSGVPEEGEVAAIGSLPLPPRTNAISVPVSAHRGDGLADLRQAIDRAAFGGESDSSATLALNSRHVAAVERALDALSRARDSLDERTGDELIALELREALDALGSIAGQVTPDDVLGRIFSTFCIGK
jgi:tRNA modification GTPase